MPQIRQWWWEVQIVALFLWPTVYQQQRCRPSRTADQQRQQSLSLVGERRNMSIRYKDLLDLLMQRADRLALVDSATGKVDAVELELYMFNALLSIVETVDL